MFSSTKIVVETFLGSILVIYNVVFSYSYKHLVMQQESILISQDFCHYGDTLSNMCKSK